MIIKDKIALGLSLVAVSLSIGTAIIGERRADLEKGRSIKAELSNTLSRIMELTKENAVLERDSILADSAVDVQFYRRQSANITQENNFLLLQAMYLAEEIPDLVSPIELNTVAALNISSGDFLKAEEYYLRSIAKTTDPYYSAFAIRAYAGFLFPQGRFEEGRERYMQSLSKMTGSNNYARRLNGFTYQLWAANELGAADNLTRAIELFKMAEHEFRGIDINELKLGMLLELDNVIKTSSNNTMRLSSLGDGN
ncbi:MAG: hypothetical protein COC19_00760 [SAR86 cluster bacterium]|uniref:Tetratricopeptide repeat protein n=1 Tax=SAR86 cluster bacterium TaxID=2030880 RepID=A0A2A4MUX5_9GAMM|nr:MAG: hypothetical protein COC19_00760 [SAR86 cluster bacterium]